MSHPLFSILIPSRNREELLRFAVTSVLKQDFDDYEIIVSDNDSSPPYAQTNELDHAGRLHVHRSDKPLSVTENWNNALRRAKGEYIIMLGDDDALTPGTLRRLAQHIETFEQPDLIYVMAYHYCYPDVVPSVPNGYLSTVANSPLFTRRAEPYILASTEARDLAKLAMGFRHDVSFNAQHYIWKRSYIESGPAQPFFQSPYPDYFACFVTFSTAPRIAVIPEPEIIIGISRLSFGFYYARNKQNEGFQQFLGDNVDLAALAQDDESVATALAMPGSQHLRNWLLAALFAEHTLGLAIGSVVNIARYRSAQIIELLKSERISTIISALASSSSSANLSADERKILRRHTLLRVWAIIARNSKAAEVQLQRLEQDLAVYFPAVVEEKDIGVHKTILDAYDFLARQQSH